MDVFKKYSEFLTNIVEMIKRARENGVSDEGLQNVLEEVGFNLSKSKIDLDLLPVLRDVFDAFSVFFSKHPDYIKNIDIEYLIEAYIFKTRDPVQKFSVWKVDEQNTAYGEPVYFEPPFMRYSNEEEIEKIEEGNDGWFYLNLRGIVVNSKKRGDLERVRKILCHEFIHFLTLQDQFEWKLIKEKQEWTRGNTWGYDFTGGYSKLINEGLTEGLSNLVMGGSVGSYSYYVWFIHLAAGLFNVDPFPSFMQGKNFLLRINPLDYFWLREECEKFSKNPDENQFKELIKSLIKFRLGTIEKFSNNIIKDYFDTVIFVSSLMPLSVDEKNELFSKFERNRLFPEKITMWRKNIVEKTKKFSLFDYLSVSSSNKDIKKYIDDSILKGQLILLLNEGKISLLENSRIGFSGNEIASIISPNVKKFFIKTENSRAKVQLKDGIIYDILPLDNMIERLVNDFTKIINDETNENELFVVREKNRLKQREIYERAKYLFLENRETMISRKSKEDLTYINLAERYKILPQKESALITDYGLFKFATYNFPITGVEMYYFYHLCALAIKEKEKEQEEKTDRSKR